MPPVSKVPYLHFCNRPVQKCQFLSVSQLQESRCFKKRIRKLEDANKKLALELEHEKGKLAGLAQSHNTLREHSNILESALAKREADLVQLNLQVKKSFYFVMLTHFKIPVLFCQNRLKIWLRNLFFLKTSLLFFRFRLF